MVLNDHFTPEQALEVMKASEDQPHVKNALKILERCYEE